MNDQIKKTALILSPCTGLHTDITNSMRRGKTSLASDRMQILPLLQCLDKNNYQTNAISYNVKYKLQEIASIHAPDICFIGKMRHDTIHDDGDQFVQFHLAMTHDLKRRGSKIVCLYSDNVCDYEQNQDSLLYKNILFMADTIITSSERLKTYARKWSPSVPIFTIPDPELYKEEAFKRLTANETCKIIWFGHDKNLEYLVKILPALITESKPSRNYLLTIMSTSYSLNQLKEEVIPKLPRSKFWKLRLVEWNSTIQPHQFITELQDSHISLIPSDPQDRLKNGVSHNRLIDSIQLGCIALTSPMESYLELKELCLIGEDFPSLLAKAINNNLHLCEQFELRRPQLMKRFSPEENQLAWQTCIDRIEQTLPEFIRS